MTTIAERHHNLKSEKSVQSMGSTSRVLNEKPPKVKYGHFISLRNKVDSDMIFRMTNSEKSLLSKFGENNRIKLPFELTKEIIVKKNHLITILN